MFTSKILTLLIILIWTLPVWSSTPQRSFIEQFSSSRIQMPAENSPLIDNPGRYPKPMAFLFEKVFAWSPTGEGAPMTPACSRELWQKHMQDPRLTKSLQLQGALAERYLRDCQGELETGPKGSLTNMIKMMSMNYEPQTHPFMRRVILQLMGNVKLKGLLALKGDLKRRPLVVVRLGIFSNVEDFRPERAWLMMLFEQSPFNVLVVENMTSTDFIANNSQFSFGGYDEGIQNIHIARLLTDSLEPISQIVDSVHFFGVSLGGHGVLFSSLLNKYNSSPAHPLINSFTALCPVVDLQGTMKSLTQTGWRSSLIDLWGRQRLNGLEEKLPAIKDHKMFNFLGKTISEIARTYRGGLSYVSTIKLPPGMVDGPEFWKLNDFWRYYKDVQQPVVIYATKTDPLVPFAMNSGRIQSNDLKVDSKNLRVVDFAQGLHCTLPIPYDWSALTSLFSSYILSHSSYFKLKEKTFNVDLNLAEWDGFFLDGAPVQFTVKPAEGSAHFITLLMQVKNSFGNVKKLSLNLPISDFDFQFRNRDLSLSEKEMLVRWLNQNLKVKMKRVEHNQMMEASWKVAN